MTALRNKLSGFPKTLRVYLGVQYTFTALAWYFRIHAQILERQTFLNDPLKGPVSTVLITPCWGEGAVVMG